MKKVHKKSDIEKRIDRARLAGAMRGYTIDEFKDYLLEFGLAKYEKTILPVKKEKVQAEDFSHIAKVIPFPGVSLSDHFQNGLDNFLREMGYID